MEKCGRCGSFRLVKFLDGFGQRRLFCKTCSGSFLENGGLSKFNNDQKNLREFNLDIHYNPRAIVRHFR
jgi:hypothetical protein